ncbi:MAG: hypothetical protein ABWK15_07810 [Dissulfuribacterales bacterium]
MFSRLTKTILFTLGFFLILSELFCVSYVFSDIDQNVSSNIVGVDLTSIKQDVLSIENIGKPVGLLKYDVISASIVDLNGDGLYEIIYLLPSGIYIAPYKHTAKPFFYRFSGFGTPVSFSVSPNSGWLAVNILIPDVGLESCLLRFDGNTLRLVQDKINMWLCFLNDDTLVGQRFDVRNMFGNVFFIVKPNDNGMMFVNEKTIIPINSISNLFAFVDLNHNDIKETIFLDRSGTLNVYESNKLLWSKNVIAINNPASFLNIKTAIVDSQKTNEKSFWMAFNEPQQQLFDKISLLKLFSNGDNYAIKSVSIKMNGRISGFNVLNGKIILIVTDRLEDPSGAGTTKIYEIEEPHI